MEVRILLLLDNKQWADGVTVLLSREFLGQQSKSNQLVVSEKSFLGSPQVSTIKSPTTR
ncbi:hypothetical protein P13BB106kb_p042 [Pectobacterium phage DU_PP_V]|uniref:Uncharacterized protein n=1 Tax=Pectobacterium phage DU_PP_V TaxID=2041492 RepID=A0A2D2W6V1_9CAUD|nr:hypothetical protein HOS40_gp127 [Pectobacterium phage DU_PP_V]ATS94026.1 hypothetical protein P13BB106kb_p042 [Pectobacterium phage DU_PP_V]